MRLWLRRAVIAARHDEIVEIIRTTNPGEATVIRRMADEFDYEGIRNLLGQ